MLIHFLSTIRGSSSYVKQKAANKSDRKYKKIGPLQISVFILCLEFFLIR